MSNFVKYLPMLRVNVIIIVIIVSEKKRGRHYFRTGPRIKLLSSA